VSPVGVQSIAMSMSVCLSAHICQKPHVQISLNFLYTLPVAMAQSSDHTAICYVLPVLGMTSRFQIMGVNRPNQRRHVSSSSPGVAPVKRQIMFGQAHKVATPGVKSAASNCSVLASAFELAIMDSATVGPCMHTVGGCLLTNLSLKPKSKTAA